jgi:hypothetical protein
MADFMHVVEFEPLHLAAVDEHGMRRRQFLRGGPHCARARRVEFAERLLQDAAPFENGCIQAATDRIEHQKLDAMTDVGEMASKVSDATNCATPRVWGLSAGACVTIAKEQRAD